MTKEFEDNCEEYIEKYAIRQTKRAITRVEEMKLKPETAYQTIEVAVKIANEWMDFIAPDDGPKFHYLTRYQNGRTEIYQEIENDHSKKNRSDDMETA